MPDREANGQKGISIWEDLRRRNVYRVGVGYAALAWLTIEVSETILPRLGLPDSSVTMVIVVAMIGLPIALFLGWTFEITPKGIVFDKPQHVSWPTYVVIDLMIVAILATAGSIYWFRVHEIDEIGTVTAENSIAVLRFLDLNDNPDIPFLGDGLTEELIHELTNLKTLRVVARTSIWSLPESGMKIPEIAELLHVSKILEGSVRSEGNKIRVAAQLIDDDGYHLWSQSYDRQLRDVLEIQKDIATQVAYELDLQLAHDAQARLDTRPTRDSAAYVEYLQGRELLRQPSTADSLRQAEAFFQTSVNLDNRFPLAFAGLCRTQLAKYRITRATDDFTAAERACHRALTLDAGLAETYVALGDLYRHAGLNDKAEVEYQAALAINGTLEEANFGLGRTYQAQGRLQAAEKTLLRSIEFEPAYWGSYMGLGNFLYRQGRYFEAVHYFEIVVRMQPDYAGGHINLGSALHWLGDWENAEVAFQNALKLAPGSMAYQNLGSVYYYLERYEDAVEMHNRATVVAPADHRAWGKLAAAQRYVPGQDGESRAAYQKAIKLVTDRLAINPEDAEDLSYLSTYLANTEKLSAAREAIDGALLLAPESPNTHYFAALLEIRSGDHKQAVTEVKKAIWNGYSKRLLGADPQFAELRKDAVFKALISENANIRASR